MRPADDASTWRRTARSRRGRSAERREKCQQRGILQAIRRYGGGLRTTPVAIRTFGPNNVDWEVRIDMDRLRTERLARLHKTLEESSLGALLCFDFANIRYATATHIGTWAIDKLIRFALIPRGGDPIMWDFGSAARHHLLYNPWLDHGHAHAGSPGESHHDAHGSRPGLSTLRGAIPRMPGSPTTSPPRSTTSSPNTA